MSSSDEEHEIETVFDMAVKMVEDRVKKEGFMGSTKESTIFVLGSKGAGKSSIIYKYLGKEESPQPTLALEYNFARRTSESGRKHILNCWELGSLYNSEQLVEVPIIAKGVKHFSAIIVLDLSQPSHLWSDLECALQGLKRAYEKQVNHNEIPSYNAKAEQRIGKDHKDASTLEILPFPVVIVGGKYDVFQDFDPEIKKQVCRFLRSISHAVGAALLFYARNIVSLTRTLRDTLNYLAYGDPAKPFRSTSTDYNGPLVIWFGMDSWDQIGVTPSNSERIGITFDSQISQIKVSTNLPDDPAKHAGFQEPVIDELRAQKNDELLSLLRDVEIRSKFEKVNS